MKPAPFCILIVDDNANNLFTLRALLGRNGGWEVVEAASGEEALMITLEREVDLILLDIQMPGMDGFETARHLKMTARTRDIPIIFVTAVFKAGEFIQQGYAIGAVDYLTKPIDENLLLNRVRLYHSLFLRQRRLEQSEARYRGYFEIGLIGMATADAQGRWMEVNDRLCEILGRSRELLLGTSWLDQTLEPERSVEQSRLEAALRGETEGYSLDKRCRRPDGSEAEISMSARLLRDRNGEPDHWLVLVQDIGDRARTLRALEEARRSAELANRSKSAFLANMSHELRTPMNAVLGFAQILMRDKSLGPLQRSQVESIERSGEHLLGLIDEVLEIVRIESGRLGFNPGVFVVDDLIQGVVEVIRPRAEHKGLRLRVVRSTRLPVHANTDAHRLRQVLLHLLGNAVKYTESGEVTLRIDTEEGGQVLFEVTDSGPGIAPEEQERIFQPFYQTAEGLAKGEGVGLGLALSREYAKLMGGAIRLDSTPGAGSRFSLRIPLPAALELPDTRREGRRVVGIQEGEAALRVVVADDQSDNRRLLAGLMQAVGYEVRTAENGEEAVRHCADRMPDLIWMDIDMPVLDGVTATRRIRSLAGGGRPKIVCLLGEESLEGGDALREAGCDALIAKPLKEGTLFGAVKTLLGVRFRYDEAEAAASGEAEFQPFADRSGAAPADFALSSLLVAEELPAVWREEMHEAVVRLDMERAQRAVGEIAAVQPELASLLTRMIEGYRFDRIESWLEGDG